MKASIPQAISVLSGGLDSSVATLMATDQYEIAMALTFDYGQRAAVREIESAARFCNRYRIEHRVIQLPWLTTITKTALVQHHESLPIYETSELGRKRSRELESAKAVWVPNRNGVFLAIAAAHAEALDATTIIVGFNAEEATTFPDNSFDFLKATNASLRYSTQNVVNVSSPTVGMEKVAIIREAMTRDLDLKQLWSCYEGGAEPCGKCESCARRKRAYEAALS